ncbi:MAG: hypothetical protein Q9214_002579, partial [Letrouitia sp. 1 TL-2023]
PGRNSASISIYLVWSQSPDYRDAMARNPITLRALRLSEITEFICQAARGVCGEENPG